MSAFQSTSHWILIYLGLSRPGLTTVGSPLGLADIDFEDSTKDGLVIDPFLSEIPSLVGGGEAIIRAVDGLQFASPDMLYALSQHVRFGLTKSHV